MQIPLLLVGINPPCTISRWSKMQLPSFQPEAVEGLVSLRFASLFTGCQLKLGSISKCCCCCSCCPLKPNTVTPPTTWLTSLNPKRLIRVWSALISVYCQSLTSFLRLVEIRPFNQLLLISGMPCDWLCHVTLSERNWKLYFFGQAFC